MSDRVKWIKIIIKMHNIKYDSIVLCKIVSLFGLLLILIIFFFIYFHTKMLINTSHMMRTNRKSTNEKKKQIFSCERQTKNKFQIINCWHIYTQSMRHVLALFMLFYQFKLKITICFFFSLSIISSHFSACL